MMEKLRTLSGVNLLKSIFFISIIFFYCRGIYLVFAFIISLRESLSLVNQQSFFALDKKCHYHDGDYALKILSTKGFYDFWKQNDYGHYFFYYLP